MFGVLMNVIIPKYFVDVAFIINLIKGHCWMPTLLSDVFRMALGTRV